MSAEYIIAVGAARREGLDSFTKIFYIYVEILAVVPGGATHLAAYRGGFGHGPAEGDGEPGGRKHAGDGDGDDDAVTGGEQHVPEEAPDGGGLGGGFHIDRAGVTVVGSLHGSHLITTTIT